MAMILRFEESRMNSDKPSFQKPGQQHSNWQQKQSQQPKPQSGHQPKPSHGTPSDRAAGQSNFGKK
jgi:hypothetical protein